MQKILLVEDNEMNRDMLSRRLIRNGYEVVIGVQGIDMAVSEKPDLILLCPLSSLRRNHSPPSPKTREKLLCDDRATGGASLETTVINLLFAGSRMSVLRLGLSTV